MDAKVYEELTWGYPMAFLSAVRDAGVGSEQEQREQQEGKKEFRFVYISGEGASSSGKSPILFSRVKVSKVPPPLPLFIRCAEC